MNSETDKAVLAILNKLIDATQVTVDQIPSVVNELIARQMLFSYSLLFITAMLMILGGAIARHFYRKLNKEVEDASRSISEGYSIAVAGGIVTVLISFIFFLAFLPEAITITFYQKAWLMDYASKLLR